MSPAKRRQYKPPTKPPTVRETCAKPGEVTQRGFQAHIRNGEHACDLCRDGKNAYQREYYHHGAHNPTVVRLNAREHREALRKAWADGFASAKLGRHANTNPYNEKAPR